MKNQLQKSGFLRQCTAKCLPLTILMLIGLLQQSYSQTCCLVDSLNISTGFNPATGAMITSGLPAADPKWNVGSYSSALSSEITATPATPLTGAADVITPPSLSGWDAVPGWISCVSAGYFYCTASSGSGILLQNTYTRTFTLCSGTCVEFNLNVADNYQITDISVSGYGSIFSGQTSGTNYTGFQNIHPSCEYLAAGTHTVTVTVNQSDDSTSDTTKNFIGFNLQGEIYAHLPTDGSLTEAIISESPSCNTYSCSYDTAGFAPVMCVGDTDGYVGYSPGTFTVSPPGAVILDTVPGGLKAMIGVDTGAFTVTRVVPCGTVQFIYGYVSARPIVTVTPDTVNLCPGMSATLTAIDTSGPGTTSSTWGALRDTIVTPTISATYSVTDTLFNPVFDNAFYCLSTAKVRVNVIPTPSIPTVSGLDTICPGFTATMTALATDSGNALHYTWGTISGTGLLSTTANPNNADPSATSVYSVCASNVACPGPVASYTVYVVPITISPISAVAICPGQTASLSASVSGADTYLWSGPGGYTSTLLSPPAFTPTATGTYTLTAFNKTGCSASATETITVKPVPGIPSVAGALGVCPGGFTTLTATATYTGSVTPTYTWGAITGTGLGCTLCDPTTITPSATGTYSVYATALSCIGAAYTFTVTVYPLPAITSVSPTFTVCPNTPDTFTLTAVTTGTTYLWTGPSGFSSTLLSPTVYITPTVTGVYTLTVYSIHSCSVSATDTMKLYPIPTGFSFNGSPTRCLGEEGMPVLQAVPLGDSIGLTYHWSPSTGLSCTVCNPTYPTPTVTTTYSVYATTPAGCHSAISTFTVTVFPLPSTPVVTGGTTDCPGVADSLHATATYTGPGVMHYVWIPTPSTCPTCNYDVVSPTVTTTYLVYTKVDSTLCTSIGTDTFKVTVPVIPVITGPDTVCIGTNTTFTVSLTGGTWSSSNSSVAFVSAAGVVTAIGNGTCEIYYTLSSGSCLVYSSVSLTVTGMPGSITGADSVCVGSTLSLYDSLSPGTWATTNSTLATVDGSGNVRGISPGTVVILYTASNGHCVGTLRDTIYVKPPVIIPPITGFDSVCVLGTTTLTDAHAGGTWYSYTPAIANVNSSGVVTGGTAGDAIIAYDVTNGCGTTEVTDTVIVIQHQPPILGNFSICSGTSTTLSNIVPRGTWSSSNTSIATINPTTGVATGISGGTATITYTASGVCGAFTVTATIGVNQAPYITTKTRVACASLTGSDAPNGLPFIITDSTGCVQICDSSVVRYYGNGYVDGTLTWVVTGGTIVHSYAGNDSVDVMWPTAGAVGSIFLGDTAGSCAGGTTVCIQVIQRPNAYFTTPSTTVCKNSNVSFFDGSTADSTSPIVSWYWSFGDGGHSSEQNPVHTFTFGATDSVTLVVKNACNCSDTFKIGINVINTTGTTISCAAIVCDSQTATYTVPPSGCPTWSISGGTILSGAGTPTVTVNWNNVASSGYGYVAETNSCSGCPGTTSITVPIVLANATITGPDVICLGEQYEYSLPLWPATQYMWGVPGDSSAVTGYRDDHKVVVDFSIPGTYSIHGWYQNTIGLCGGNEFKTIHVIPKVVITGVTTSCPNVPESYTAGGAYVTWTLSNMSGTVVSTGTGTTFTYSFPTSGLYMLSTTGTVCSDPLTINIFSVPPVDSITGPDTICIGRVYNYTAHSVPGSVYFWTAIGGTVLPETGSNNVSVTWTGGTMALSVFRQNSTYPYCISSSIEMHIGQDPIHLNITGDTLPCANSHRNYATNYTRGEVYNWTVIPVSAGSVVSGDNTTAVNVLWNNAATATSASVVLKVRRCDTTVSDTFHVTLQASRIPTVTCTPDTVCPGDGVYYTATSGGGSYIWNAGGTPVTTTSNLLTHAAPANLLTHDTGFTASVTVMPDPTAACPSAGTATVHFVIKPGPQVTVSSTLDGFCSGNPVLTGTVTANAGATTLQWCDNGANITGATHARDTPTVGGNYSMIVIAADGCIGQSNIVTIDTGCPSGDLTTCTIPITASGVFLNCNTIQLTGNASTYTSPRWLHGGTLLSGSLSGSTYTSDYTYGSAGVYNFTFEVNIAACGTASIPISVTIGAKPAFTDVVSCGTGGMDNVTCIDNTSIMPGWTIVGRTWSGPVVGGTATVSGSVSAPGTYTETETVKYIDPASDTFVCTATKSITLPTTAISAAYTISTPTTICSGVPITFMPTHPAGIVAFSWNFGDLSSSSLDTTQRTYTWQSGSGSTDTEKAVLAVTDSLGCTAKDTIIITVEQNILNGGVGSNQVVCANEAPVTLEFIGTAGLPISAYLWSNGAVTDTIKVDTTGTYWVTVVGQYQCKQTLPTIPISVRIINAASGNISGSTDYCVGSPVQLACFAGNSITYHWYRNGVSDGTSISVNDMLPVGNYQYMLTTTIIDTASGMSCSDTTRDSVYVHPLPSAPVITGPVLISCSPYSEKITATDSSAGLFNWSDGRTGSIDTAYAGGAYEVWITDHNGCTNNASIAVPADPGSFFAYFPSGCYSICSGQLPLTLYGPPDQQFHPWEWLRNSSVVSSGIGVMPTYNVTTAGTYNWGLEYNSCPLVSPPMDVSTVTCTHCGGNPTATMTCDTGSPASYTLTVHISCVEANTTFVLGTNMGPIVPFSGTLPTPGTYTLTLTFTTLTIPPPANVEVEIHFNLPDGTQCFQEVKVTLPTCTWQSERMANNDSNLIVAQPTEIANAMLVFPNPSSGMVTVAYNYGSDAVTSRSIEVYDETGRKVQSTLPTDVHGNWQVNTAGWMPGVYIIRMAGDGKALHTQRLVVTN